MFKFIKRLFSCKHKNIFPMLVSIDRINGIEKRKYRLICMDCGRELERVN